MQTNNWHKLDQYLMGKASEQETQEVKKLIETDPEFAFEAEIHQQLINVIVARSEHKLIDKIAQWEDSYSNPKPEKRLNLRGIIPAIAAVILTLIALNLIFFPKAEPRNKKLTSDLYTSHFTPYPDLITQRNSSQDKSTLEFMRHYNAGSFEEANEIFVATQNNLSGRENPLLFYYGVSLVGSKSYTRGIEVLNEVNTEAYEEASEWYTALAYGISGDREAAKELLIRIARHSEHAYFQEANSILDHLKLERE